MGGGKHSRATGLEQLIVRMERGEFDLIAVGRALISDARWVERIQSGDWASLKGFDPAALATLA